MDVFGFPTRARLETPFIEQAPDIKKMEANIRKMFREGKVNMAFMVMISMNLQRVSSDTFIFYIRPSLLCVMLAGKPFWNKASPVVNTLDCAVDWWTTYQSITQRPSVLINSCTCTNLFFVPRSRYYVLCLFRSSAGEICSGWPRYCACTAVDKSIGQTPCQYAPWQQTPRARSSGGRDETRQMGLLRIRKRVFV